MSVAELPARPQGAELIRTEGLTKHFRLGGFLSQRMLHAVDDVNLSVRENEIVALVGESGSGKSTIARLIARVYTPTSGEIYHRGRALSTIRSRRDELAYRGDVPMVFQDPYGSLSPVYRVSHGIMRALVLHRPDLSRRGREEEAERLLEAVGLAPAGDFLGKFPYQLSGGQRQRIGFAAALACRPELILADEPVSMLDVSVRIGVLNLMASLRRRERVSFLYITHDIASARYVADRLVVMYAGQVAESGPVEDVLAHPKHPYTQLLLAAVPDPRAPVSVPSTDEVQEPPRVIDPGEGCRFRARCPYAIEKCAVVTPRLRELRHAHEAACHVATSDLTADGVAEEASLR
ncbi:MAG TPA: ABC transporter ATP-binding protein [Candidatus Dormibacteraeota bacterium]|nr:ABC transporter ATP-binding protein [Candidatus Dormibacteraeota bacterium]